MSLNDTPSGERIHIGFFGRRNAGKSSVVNAVTGQELAVVSDTKGTTTDPVSKAMELLPLGPVMIIDTPGFDDKGHLGELRVRKTKQILNRTDIAVLVIDATEGIKQCEEELLAIFKEKEIPYLLVYNKEDILSEELILFTLKNSKSYIGPCHLFETIPDELKTAKVSLLCCLKHFAAIEYLPKRYQIDKFYEILSDCR